VARQLPSSAPALDIGLGRQRTILIVDDSPINVKLLEGMLAPEGYTTAVAHSGEAALEMVGTLQPDLVLLDVVMPGLNGYEVCRRLRLNPATQLLPVVMVTGGDAPDRVLSIEAGADDFLVKPIDRTELVARVRSLLRVRAYHETLTAQAAELARLNTTLEQRVQQQVDELERVGRLRRFLSPQLAELLISSGGESILQSHRRQIAVVYCRLPGFTQLAETTAPEEVMDVLGAYHLALGELIHELDGTVGAFSGDAVQIFFNDPLPCADPAVPAVRLVLVARQKMAALTRAWARHGYHLAFGAAVTLGYATLGQIGFPGRVDYGAVGPVVDLADRLSAEARDGQLLITRPVYAAVEELVEVAALGERAVAGFLRPVEVFSVERARAARAREAASGAGPAERPELLSLREREVAALIARGLTNRQIADELVISERTAEGHVEHIRDKLGVRSRAEVAVWAVQSGLVAPPPGQDRD